MQLKRGKHNGSKLGLILSITDTGRGMDKNDKASLFQKFSRGKNISRIHTEGTGLGFYVARQIIEAHKGTIWAGSPGKDQGSTFSLGKAGNISYIEVEKMTTWRRQKEDRNELIRLAKNLQIVLFKNRKEFIDLCNRLTATCDWRFNGSVEHCRKLEKLLNKY